LASTLHRLHYPNRGDGDATRARLFRSRVELVCHTQQSLSPPQIRFVEMIIDQLTARSVMEPGALYEAPFTGLQAGGPDGLFAGRDEIITGIFQAIHATQPVIQSHAG
jgi:hypothetical protein